MKIGILTQPLQGNYGGIIQNWALQQALKKIGFEPITINVFPRDLSFSIYIKWNVISILRSLLKGKRFKYYHLYKHQIALFQKFIERNIITTKSRRNYTKNIISEYNIDALIVGSDQVWRPMYNEGCLEEMFLKFAKDVKCPKLSYAASFGSDIWEYDQSQTSKCKDLIQLFDKVSVREPSGIKLCNEYLDVNAVQVLDPTLLLNKNDYLELIKDTPRLCSKPFLAAYILDLDDSLQIRILQKAQQLKLPPLIYSAGSGAKLTMEQWLSIFRDAEFIFTDSFHGSVFSYIFNKPFEFIMNENRGATRFKVIEDLLSSDDIEDVRQQSINYLKSIYELSKSL